MGAACYFYGYVSFLEGNCWHDAIFINSWLFNIISCSISLLFLLAFYYKKDYIPYAIVLIFFRIPKTIFTIVNLATIGGYSIVIIPNIFLIPLLVLILYYNKPYISKNKFINWLALFVILLFAIWILFAWFSLFTQLDYPIVKN